jgi:hypothetical protein
LFTLPEQGALTVEKCTLGTKEDSFSAMYEYKGHFHRREIIFRKAEDEIEITDTCSHKGAQLSFVCVPGIEPIIDNGGFHAGKAVFSFDRAKSIVIETSQYSAAYGKLQPNKLVRVTLSGKICIYRIHITFHYQFNVKVEAV